MNHIKNLDVFVTPDNQGENMRLGILGGSFNPVHLGHIELARFVMDNIPILNEVWLMPCVHTLLGKQNIDLLHRLDMCELACKGYDRIKTSAFEYIHSSKNTHEMLSEFNKYYNNTIKPFMIIGMDEALQIQQWVDWENLISTNTFIVVDRTGFKPTKKKLWFQSAPHIYLKDKDQVLPVISSTVIRNKEEGYKYLLRPTVLKYIEDNKLYE